MSKVVYCREAFKRTAWEFHSADGVATYLFLFAMQNPYYIQFARLESVEHFVEMKAVGVHNWDEIAMNTVTRRFLCSAGEGLVRWDALPRLSMENIHIVQDMQYSKGLEMCSSSAPISLHRVLQRLPDSKSTKKHTKKPTTRAVTWKESVIQKYPWMQGTLEAGSAVPLDATDEAPPAAVCDEDIEEAFRVLDEHHDRISAAGDDDVQVVDFAVAV